MNHEKKDFSLVFMPVLAIVMFYTQLIFTKEINTSKLPLSFFASNLFLRITTLEMIVTIFFEYSASASTKLVGYT